jgi:hypothetical protein
VLVWGLGVDPPILDAGSPMSNSEIDVLKQQMVVTDRIPPGARYFKHAAAFDVHLVNPGSFGEITCMKASETLITYSTYRARSAIYILEYPYGQ